MNSAHGTQTKTAEHLQRSWQYPDSSLADLMHLARLEISKIITQKTMTPQMRTLQNECNLWMEKNPPGTRLKYHGLEVTVVSNAWIFGGHTPVVRVEFDTGKHYTVALKSLTPIKK